MTDFSEDPSVTTLDVERGRTSVGGNDKIYRRMIEIFATEYEHVDDNLKKMLQEGDYAAGSNKVHAIKSAAGQIGALPLFALCKKLEQSLTDESSEVEVCFSQFCKQFQAVVDAITLYLSSSDGEKGRSRTTS